MNTPRFLLGATLLFWGWQSGCLAVAALCAIALESARLVPTRWEIEERDFDRLWNLCSVLFLGAAVYALTTTNGPLVLTSWLEPPQPPTGQPNVTERVMRTSLAFLQWWPLAVFPFVLAQAWARQPAVDGGTFSWFLRTRRARSQKPAAARRTVILAHPYFALCLGTACVGQPTEMQSFPFLAVLLVWALWPSRPRRFALPLWAGVMTLAVGMGFFGQRGLRVLYDEAQRVGSEWLQGVMGGRVDPLESRTSIGHIGRLKLSGQIVLRVEPRNGSAPPTLLREASYDTFKSPTWSAAGRGKEFDSATHEADESTWVLRRGVMNQSIVAIAGYLPGGQGVLALPAGATRLEQLPVFVLKTNRFAAARVDSGPGFFALESKYSPGAGIDSPPTDDDRKVPEAERAAVAQVAGELGLTNALPEEVLRRLTAFFQDRFEYSLEGGPALKGRTNLTPMASFLLQNRRGHCEHFATATALLLRQAKIPARYAVGYAVQEPAGKGFVVRQRHAHAWCLVYRDGAWQDFDTTPASWVARDAAQASSLEFLSDAWSRLWFEFTKLRYGQSGFRRYLGWLVLLLFVLVLVQLLWGRRWRKALKDRRLARGAKVFPGLDSELYLIERALAERGYPRDRAENLATWFARLQGVAGFAPVQRFLANLLRLHNRYRFDPAGLSADERESLRQQAAACLQELQRLGAR